jgi:hypothetical protein
VRRIAALLLALAPATVWAQEGEPHPDDPPRPTSPPDVPTDEPGPPVDNETLPTEVPPDAEAPAAEEPAPPPPNGRLGRRKLEDTSWRRRAREGEPSTEVKWFEPLHFLFELRFGPYFPEVDEEFADLPEGQKPYERFFGDGPVFYFGIELDWMPVYLRYVGSLGVGLGWGYARASGNTFAAGTDTPSESETALNIFPMHVSGVFRVDGPLRELDVPVAPYVKIGLGAGAWSVSGPDGDTTDDEGRSGEDTSLGMHLAIGAAVALNAFDPASGMQMREATGIRYVYLWGEFMYANLDGIGDESMHVGTQTAVFGLAADF